MIKFKAPLSYKYYFLGNFYGMSGSLAEKLFSIFFIFLFIWCIWFKFYDIAIFAIAIPVFYYFVIPLIKLFFARAYYKMNTIEYFFGGDSFGYSIGAYKLEIKKHKIEYILVKPNYLLIKIFKQKLYFVGEIKAVKNVEKLLLQSDYKNLIRTKN